MRCLGWPSGIIRDSISLLTPHGILPPEQVGWEPGDPFLWPDTRRASEFLHVALQMLKAGFWEEPEWQQRFCATERYQYGVAAVTGRGSDETPTTGRVALVTGPISRQPQTVKAARNMRDRGQLTLIRSALKSLESTHLAGWQLGLASGSPSMRMWSSTAPASAAIRLSAN